MRPTAKKHTVYEDTISHSGHRLTPQRRQVYEVLLAERDHPTATEVFLRAKQRMPSISLATVYNCLETLVGCGLARQVNVDREATRYCPNLEEHAHFVCAKCGKVLDVPLDASRLGQGLCSLPEGFQITHSEISLKGTCPDCSSGNNA